MKLKANLVKLLVILGLSVGMFVATPALAFGDTLEPTSTWEQAFGDSNFRDVIIAKYAPGASPQDQIGPAAAAIAAETDLDVSSKGISDLSGIKYFVTLITLDCSNNNLTSLDVSGLDDLLNLNCNNNQLYAVTGLFRKIDYFFANDQALTVPVASDGSNSYTSVYTYPIASNQILSADVPGEFSYDASTMRFTVASVPSSAEFSTKYNDLSMSDMIVRGELTFTLVHIVSFVPNGGSAVNFQVVYPGGIAIAPANPTRTGYVFAGWYLDAAFTQPWDFSTPITADIVLYARWDEAGSDPGGQGGQGGQGGHGDHRGGQGGQGGDSNGLAHTSDATPIAAGIALVAVIAAAGVLIARKRLIKSQKNNDE